MIEVGDLVYQASHLKKGAINRIGIVLETKNYVHGGYRLNVLWEDGDIYAILSKYVKRLKSNETRRSSQSS